MKDKMKTRQSGFIAQEVQESANRLGYDFGGVDAPKDAAKDASKRTYGLRYAEFVVPLVKATQELHQKVASQQALLDLQSTQLAAYQKVISKLEHRLEVVEQFAKKRHPSEGKVASSKITQPWVQKRGWRPEDGAWSICLMRDSNYKIMY